MPLTWVRASTTCSSASSCSDVSLSEPSCTRTDKSRRYRIFWKLIPAARSCASVTVASAGGDDRQYDCCDGLLCCFGQSTNVCGECCADSDCKYAPGGVCNHFQCEYPTCEGKYETCDHDSDCCHGLKCFGGVCKHKHHH